MVLAVVTVVTLEAQEEGEMKPQRPHPYLAIPRYLSVLGH